MDQREITSDGWWVVNLKTFRLIADHPPPRPYGYLQQLREDSRNWKPVAFWVIGIGTIAAAIAFAWWPLLLLGGALLYWWFTMFRSTVRYIRESPACVGKVDALTPHPLLRGFSIGVARMDDGREVPVGLPTLLAEGIIGKSKSAEILFLHDSRSEYSLGFGVRAVPGYNHN